VNSALLPKLAEDRVGVILAPKLKFVCAEKLVPAEQLLANESLGVGLLKELVVGKASDKLEPTA
jgi:hypothetical protein